MTTAGPLLVLDDLSLEMRGGDLTVILGPSGCGKTTLLRIAAGLDVPSQGVVRLDGEKIVSPTRRVAMVFQQPTLFPWLTVFQNVAFAPRLRGGVSDLLSQKIARYLELTRLEQFQGSFPRELSIGMQQRTAIARSLASEPDLVLLDEPFSALDVQTRSEMQQLLLSVCRETNLTAAFVTHSVEEGLFLGDRVVVLSSRPARVVVDFEVHFGEDRCDELKTTPKFLQREAELTRLLREHS